LHNSQKGGEEKKTAGICESILAIQQNTAEEEK
jgi:hypothetical protein